jgi:TRAP-type C4-dicarboxylate transport system permease small subunit
VSVALAAMAILPLAEIVLRATLRIGGPGSSSIVQHLTLFVGLLGGAIAAREGRLLSLSKGASLFSGRMRSAVRIVTGAFSAAVSALLCAASVRFVLSEKQGGNILTAGLPVWVVELILPVGFALVALRLWWGAADGWAGRAAVAALAAAACGIGARPPLEPSALVLPALGALVAATILGAPVFTALGGAALILFWGAGGSHGLDPG